LLHPDRHLQAFETQIADRVRQAAIEEHLAVLAFCLAIGPELPFEHPFREASAVDPGQGVAAMLHLLADDAPSGLHRRCEAARLQRLDERRLAGSGTAGENEEAVVVWKHVFSPTLVASRVCARDEDKEGYSGKK